MTIKQTNKTAIYACHKKPTTPEEFKEIDDIIADPYTLTGKDRQRAFYE